MKFTAFLWVLLALLWVGAFEARGQICRGGRCYPSTSWVEYYPSTQIVSYPVQQAQQQPSTPAQIAEPAGFNLKGPIGGNPPTGVATDRWTVHREGIFHGDTAGPGEAGEFKVGDLVDDSDKPWAVIVGDAGFRREAAGKVSASKHGKDFRVVSYAPGAWQAGEVGYENPGIYLVSAAGDDGKGKAFHFQADLEGLEKPMEATINALRKKLPDFDPAKLLDLRRFRLPISLAIPWSELAGGIGLLGCAFFGGRTLNPIARKVLP